MPRSEHLKRAQHAMLEAENADGPLRNLWWWVYEDEMRKAMR